MSRRALIVGGSSGIGAALAGELARRGYRVAITARREAELQTVADTINARVGEKRVIAVVADAADFAQVPALFDQIADRLGGLDLVIFNAGIMATPPSEGYTTDADLEMVDVNLKAAIAWLNEAADFFTRLQGGTIIGISSVAGERGRRKNPVYGATKAALTHYLEALRNRLAPYGVRVVTIKPGYVDTAMVKSVANPIWLISPEEAARRISDAISGGPDTLFVPRRWGVLMWVVRTIPSFLFRKLNV